MGDVQAIRSRGVRLGDAVTTYLATIPVANTRRGYAAALNQLVRDFGADTDVALNRSPIHRRDQPAPQLG